MACLILDCVLTDVHQVFMTRRKSLQTIHEPFGDAFYFGPERMGSRFETDEESRLKSGFADSTFKTILDRIDSEAEEVCFPPIGISSSRFFSLCVLLCSKGHSTLMWAPLAASHRAPVRARLYALCEGTLQLAEPPRIPSVTPD